MNSRSVVLNVTAAALLGLALAPADGSAAVLGLRHVGPLHLGMTRSAAVKTGWLAHRGRGCPLGGPPIPITYRADGRRAPRGLRGSAEFTRGRLTNLSFTKGVRTTLGVRVGVTTAARMTSRYRQAGFTATSSFEQIFGGTFVIVSRGSSPVIGAFATGSVISMLSIPAVTVCE